LRHQLFLVPPQLEASFAPYKGSNFFIGGRTRVFQQNRPKADHANFTGFKAIDRTRPVESKVDREESNRCVDPAQHVDPRKSVLSVLDEDSELGVRGRGAPTAEGGHSFRTLGQNLKRMVVRLLDYVEHPLDVAERYLLVKQVGHRVHEVDRRFMALQRLGQAPRSSLSRWTP
jgi:hypothetical protein